MLIVCKRWVGDCYIDTSFPRGNSSTSSSFWFGLLNRGSLRAQSPLSRAGSHFAGILSPTESNRRCTWLYYCLKCTCFRCSSAYLHWCISWLTARLRVNICHLYQILFRAVPCILYIDYWKQIRNLVSHKYLFLTTSLIATLWIL